jgi:alanyl-tRNA synthetase
MSGSSEPVLFSLLPEVFGSVDHFYSESELRKNIGGVIKSEEESFLSLLPVGCEYLESHLKNLKLGQQLSGEFVFHLNDAFGFPVDLTAQICDERGLGIDMDGVRNAQQRHREISRVKVDLPVFGRVCSLTFVFSGE